MHREDLVLVIEECAEVIQAATKILRFGEDDHHPSDSARNSEVLVKEIGQLLHCIDRLDLPMDDMIKAKARHREQLLTYGPNGTYLAEKVTTVADKN